MEKEQLETICKDAKAWAAQNEESRAIIVLAVDEHGGENDNAGPTSLICGKGINIIAMMVQVIEEDKHFSDFHHKALLILAKMRMEKILGRHNEETEDNGTKE